MIYSKKQQRQLAIASSANNRLQNQLTYIRRTPQQKVEYINAMKRAKLQSMYPNAIIGGGVHKNPRFQARQEANNIARDIEQMRGFKFR